MSLVAVQTGDEGSDSFQKSRGHALEYLKPLSLRGDHLNMVRPDRRGDIGGGLGCWHGTGFTLLTHQRPVLLPLNSVGKTIVDLTAAGLGLGKREQ